MILAACSHQAWADRRNSDAAAAYFGVEAFGKADEGELGCRVGKHVRDGEFAADAGDVHDAGAASGCRKLCHHVGQCGVGCVERGEEVDTHGGFKGFQWLGFEGTDGDDAGIVDENVDAAEAADGFENEVGAGGGIAQVGGDEEEVFGEHVRMLGEEFGLGGFEFGAAAGGEDKPGSFARKTRGDSVAKAAGATRDDDDGAFRNSSGAQKANGGNCRGGGSDGGESEGEVAWTAHAA